MKHSAMDIFTDNDKVRKPSSTPALQVSVSFGRFGNDLLSSEKRSNCSPNKYLEEVEKCSTAGSVALKKAYFEAHCQKIAAQKTELFEQEKHNKDDSLRSDDQTGTELISKTSEANPGKEEVKREITLIEDVLEKDISCVTESEKIEFEQRLDCSDMNRPSEADLVEEFEEVHPIESKDISEQPESLIGEKSNKAKTKEKVVKPNRDMAAEKIAQSKKEKTPATGKKQQMSSIVKPHQMMNPRVSKTTLSLITPASQLPSKANYNSSLLRSRNLSVENKKLAPKYLNMSLNLGSYGSHPSSATTLTRSFIMEKTADKDSIKQAFKTCQNNFSQLRSSWGEDRSVSKKVTSKGTEPRISASLTARKENRGSIKNSGETFRNLKAPSSVSSLRSSDEQTKKTKELLKKDEEKSKSKEGERRSLQSKSKAEQEAAEMKNLRKSPNFRAAATKVFPTTKIIK